jgi:hypothetical protein
MWLGGCLTDVAMMTATALLELRVGGCLKQHGSAWLAELDDMLRVVVQ